MDGMPGELGEMVLVLDERARERLAEGRRLLDVIVSEHGSLRQAAFEEGGDWSATGLPCEPTSSGIRRSTSPG